MSLRLTFKTLVAIACCVILPGCGLWKPWGPKAAAPTVATAPSQAEEGKRLEGLIDAPTADEAKPKRSFKLAWPFSGRTAKEEKVATKPSTASDITLPSPQPTTSVVASNESKPAASTAPIGSAAPATALASKPAEAAPTPAPAPMQREVLDGWRPVGPRLAKSTANMSAELAALPKEVQRPKLEEKATASEVATSENPAKDTWEKVSNDTEVVAGKTESKPSASAFVINKPPVQDATATATKPVIILPVEAISSNAKPVTSPPAIAQEAPAAKESAPPAKVALKSQFVPAYSPPATAPPAASAPPTDAPAAPEAVAEVPHAVETRSKLEPRGAEIAVTKPGSQQRQSNSPGAISLKSAFQPRVVMTPPTDAPEQSAVQSAAAPAAQQAVVTKPEAPSPTKPDIAPAPPMVKAPALVVNRFVPQSTPVVSPEKPVIAAIEKPVPPSDAEETVAALRAAFLPRNPTKLANQVAGSENNRDEFVPPPKSTFQPRVAPVRPLPQQQVVNEGVPTPSLASQTPPTQAEPALPPIRHLVPNYPAAVQPQLAAKPSPAPSPMRSGFQPPAPVANEMVTRAPAPEPAVAAAPTPSLANSSAWSPGSTQPATPALPPVQEPGLVEAPRKNAPSPSAKIVDELPPQSPSMFAAQQPQAPPAGILFAPHRFAMSAPVQSPAPQFAPPPVTKKAAEDTNDRTPIGALARSITLGKSGGAAPQTPAESLPPRPEPIVAATPVHVPQPVVVEPTPAAQPAPQAPVVAEMIIMPKPQHASRPSTIVMDAPVEIEEELPAVVSVEEYQARYPKPQPRMPTTPKPQFTPQRAIASSIVQTPAPEPVETLADEPEAAAPIVNASEYAKPRTKAGLQGFVTTSQTVPRDIAPVMSPQEFERRKAVRRR